MRVFTHLLELEKVKRDAFSFFVFANTFVGGRRGRPQNACCIVGHLTYQFARGSGFVFSFAKRGFSHDATRGGLLKLLHVVNLCREILWALGPGFIFCFCQKILSFLQIPVTYVEIVNCFLVGVAVLSGT